jgi:hypothetical protein
VHGAIKAAQLWHRYPLGIPVDLRWLATELGLTVVTFPFRGRIREMIIDEIIGVRPGLERAWFRWYVAHGIGHHLLHVGASLYVDSWQWVGHAKAERQAEEFAARLLGGPEGCRFTARELGVPVEKHQRIRDLVPSVGTDEIR